MTLGLRRFAQKFSHFYHTLLQLGNKLLVSGSGLFFLVYVLIRVSLGNLQTLTAVRWQDSMAQNCVDFFRICGELQKKYYLALYVLRFLPLFISAHGLMHDVKH